VTNWIRCKLIGTPEIFDSSWVNKDVDFNRILPIPELVKDFEPDNDMKRWVKIKKALINWELLETEIKDPLSNIPLKTKQLEAVMARNLLLGDRRPIHFDEKETAEYLRCQKCHDMYEVFSCSDWRRRYWGTRSNGLNAQVFSCDNSFEIKFDTATTPPLGIVNQIAMTRTGAFEFCWADENLGYNSGRIKVVRPQGERLDDVVIFQDGIKEAYEMGFKLWPEHKANFQWVNNQYVFVEEE